MRPRILLALAVLVTLGQAPVTDQERVQAAVNGCGRVQLEARTYVLHAPVALPACPVQIEGARGRTVLQWGQGDGLVGVYHGYYGGVMPLTLRDVDLACAGLSGACGTALSLTWPDAGSVNEPTAIVEHVTIRPEPTTGAGRSWTHGVVLTNGWYARLRDVVIHGDNHDASALHTAVTLRRWSTGVQIVGLLVYGVRTGVLIEASEVGQGEGPFLSRVEMVGVEIGVHARSTLAGGRPSPLLTLSDSHIAARRVGVMLEGRTQAGITNALIYGVPRPDQTFVGVYVAGGSHHARIVGNQVYALQPGAMTYGVLADASSGGVIGNNIVTDARIGIWLTPSTAGWAVGANAVSGAAWGAVLNQGRP